MAQLVEHWLPKPRVAGSSPVYRSLTTPSPARAGDGALLLLKGKYIPKSLTYRQHSVGGVSKFQDFGTLHLFIMWLKIKAFMEKNVIITLSIQKNFLNGKNKSKVYV